MVRMFRLASPAFLYRAAGGLEAGVGLAGKVVIESGDLAAI